MVQNSNSGHQLLLPPANWCPMLLPPAEWCPMFANVVRTRAADGGAMGGGGGGAMGGGGGAVAALPAASPASARVMFGQADRDKDNSLSVRHCLPPSFCCAHCLSLSFCRVFTVRRPNFEGGGCRRSVRWLGRAVRGAGLKFRNQLLLPPANWCPMFARLNHVGTLWSQGGLGPPPHRPPRLSGVIISSSIALSQPAWLRPTMSKA